MVLVKEINDRLTGMYVNNIYSLGENQIIRLRSENKEKYLVLSPKFGSWITEKLQYREETTSFTSSIRNFLNRRKLTLCEQVDFDRIYKFSFDDKIFVYLELIRPGNIIITDEFNNIKLCLREYVTTSRSIKVGREYKPPLQKRKSPKEINQEDLQQDIFEKSDFTKLGKVLALPKKYLLILQDRLKALLSINDKQRIASETIKEIKRLVQEAEINPEFSLVRFDSEEEILVVRNNFEKDKITSSASELCDFVFVGKLTLKDNELERKKEELSSTIDRLKIELEKVKSDAERHRELARKIIGIYDKEEIEKILIEYGYKNKLSEFNNPASISSFFFDLAKEREKKAEQIIAAIKNIEERIRNLKRSHETKTKQVIRKEREWFEKFRWFLTSSGKLAIGGRDASSNSTIIRKYLEERDTVYHADIHGSPFFILKGGKEQGEQDIIEVSQATVSFSSAWKIGLSSADSFWVYPEQISLSAQAGEYLPKGSFVIRGKKNYVRHVLLQLAIGISREGKVTSGPESAISKWADCYVVIEPFKAKTSELGKKIKSFFEETMNNEVNLEDIILSLPAGGGRIIRRKIVHKE